MMDDLIVLSHRFLTRQTRPVWIYPAVRSDSSISQFHLRSTSSANGVILCVDGITLISDNFLVNDVMVMITDFVLS